MKVFTFKKNIYLLLLAIITLLGIVIVPTYAKFIKDYTTSNDVAGMSLSFNIGITNIEEYEVITVPAGGADAFNVKVTNSGDSTLYYGIWYRMVEPLENSSDIIISRVDGTTPTTSGQLNVNASTSPSIIIINNTDTDITINIGVATSNTSTSDIEYIGGKKLINGVYSINYMNTTNGTKYFNNDTYRNFITTASFVDYIDTSNAALDANEASITWDMSSNQDNRIIAWLEENETTDEEGNKYYDLYIGSNEKIYAKSLGNFFNSMSGLLNISFTGLDTSLTTNMLSMFQNCSSIENLDLSSFDTSNVKYISGPYFHSMFNGCSSLVELNISNFDTSNVTSMNSLFQNCSSLVELNVSNFDTSNVTNMNAMFNGCSSLVELNVSNFDTSNVTNMEYMFYECYSLSELNLSNFDTSNVTNMGNLFAKCSNLINLNIFNWNVGNVTNFGDMFQSCSSLTELDLSGWDTSKVARYNGTFYGARNAVVSLTIMNPNVTTFNNMLIRIKAITLYYVGDNPETTDINESTYDIVEAMIAAYSSNPNIINGGCTGDYCTVT